jgi:hypothetical protein
VRALKGYEEEGEYALRLEVEGKEYVRSRGNRNRDRRESRRFV